MRLSRSFSPFVCSYKPTTTSQPLYFLRLRASSSFYNYYKHNISPKHFRRFTTTPQTMALNPKFAGQRLLFNPPSASSNGVAPAVHTLELFLDYVCRFSAKQFATVYNEVIPLIKSNPKWASSVEIIFRQQIQPWHPSSTLVHEAGVAVALLAPEKYWAFSDALFKDQLAYFDEAVVNESRNDTYRRLAKLADSVGVDENKVYELLAISDKVPEGGHENNGNKVTADLKLQIRYGRLIGVHVSPTVVFDGIVANDISSSWTKDQWQQWLTKNLG
ncbi:uncharacterized protein F4822DRAFT_392568 [Hypoxylon trugodes]|uniref:uncharacterized protein n=1 Tax=Hypoxylon trugodes TaxID=326681 RepID=UPI0021A11C60|nr:uncharacterized protein F4822DRAFT_392568 [Hypoxylon trugodes]KAI1392909.1 hypothetical protein F4822DRAFT_392568 [Hypoxylon trugodes]